MASGTTQVQSPSTKAAVKRWQKARQVAGEYLRARDNGSTHQVYDFRTGEVLAIAPVGDREQEMQAWAKAKTELAERSGAERPWVRNACGMVVQVSH